MAEIRRKRGLVDRLGIKTGCWICNFSGMVGLLGDEGESANDSKEGSINGLKDNAVIVEKKTKTWS